MSGLSANKKILISVLAFVLIIAAIVGVLLVLGGNGKKTPNPDNSEPNTAGFVHDADNTDNSDNTNETTEPVSYTLPTTSPAMNTNNSDFAAQSAIIEAYISGNYYISAVIDADGERMNMDMALRGKDFQTTVDMDGQALTIIYMNNGIYLVDENSKKYIEFSQTLLAMSGIDLSELSQMTEELDLSKYNFTGMDISQTELNGYTADCYTYYTADSSIFFYFVGTELKRIDYGDADGNIGITMDVYQFSPTYPANMFNLSGLTKTTLLDFFGTTFE